MQLNAELTAVRIDWKRHAATLATWSSGSTRPGIVRPLLGTWMIGG